MYIIRRYALFFSLLTLLLLPACATNASSRVTHGACSSDANLLEVDWSEYTVTEGGVTIHIPAHCDFVRILSVPDSRPNEEVITPLNATSVQVDSVVRVSLEGDVLSAVQYAANHDSDLTHVTIMITLGKTSQEECLLHIVSNDALQVTGGPAPLPGFLYYFQYLSVDMIQ